MLLKKKNQLNKEKEQKKNDLNNSFTRKRKAIKPKIFELEKDIESTKIDVALSKNNEKEVRISMVTPSKRKTMKPNLAKPYTSNY